MLLLNKVKVSLVLFLAPLLKLHRRNDATHVSLKYFDSAVDRSLRVVGVRVHLGAIVAAEDTAFNDSLGSVGVGSEHNRLSSHVLAVNHHSLVSCRHEGFGMVDSSVDAHVVFIQLLNRHHTCQSRPVLPMLSHDESACNVEKGLGVFVLEVEQRQNSLEFRCCFTLVLDKGGQGMVRRVSPGSHF